MLQSRHRVAGIEELRFWPNNDLGADAFCLSSFVAGLDPVHERHSMSSLSEITCPDFVSTGLAKRFRRLAEGIRAIKVGEYYLARVCAQAAKLGKQCSDHFLLERNGNPCKFDHDDDWPSEKGLVENNTPQWYHAWSWFTCELRMLYPGDLPPDIGVMRGVRPAYQASEFFLYLASAASQPSSFTRCILPSTIRPQRPQ